MAKQHHPKDCSSPAPMVAPLWCASRSADKTHSGGCDTKSVTTVTFGSLEKGFSFVFRQPGRTTDLILNHMQVHMSIEGRIDGTANHLPVGGENHKRPHRRRL